MITEIIERNKQTVEANESFSPLNNLWTKVEQLGGPVIAHAHLDRARTITMNNWALINAPLQEKWRLVRDIKESRTSGEIFNSMVETVDWLAETEGIRTIGTFIDVDQYVGDKALEAAEKLRSYYRGDITFVFINQTLEGVLDKDAYKWFMRGAEFCDILGGLPGRDAPNTREHTQVVLQVAQSMGKMAHVHVDQLNTTDERETEMLAQETIKAKMHGRVAAVHSISLAAHKKEYREYVYSLMRDAGLMTIACPTAWINAKRKEEQQVSHNAIAPVDEMTSFGIMTALGPDNIQDIYMPFTTGSMKTELQVLLEATHLYDPDNLALIATFNGKIALGLEPNVYFPHAQ